MELVNKVSVTKFSLQLNLAACYRPYTLQLKKEIACQRECSRGEDYRLIKLTIFDYSSKKEIDVMVECKGQDAARFQNVDHVHGWEEDVVSMVAKNKEKNNELFISFECETLKAEKDAEDHINRYLPHLIGQEAVVNIGTMKIQGLNFNSDDNQADMLEDKELDTGLPVTGSVITFKLEKDYKYEQPDCSVGSNMANDYDLSNLLGVCKQKSTNPEEDMIRQILAEELQAEGVTGNIPENKWEDSSLGWKIKKQVLP
ncbi:uncharacterized protein LOC131076211 isoform X2 [Cryptomeria japonica]|uniref:uncharacterized protein LOC131076211 isoform X2 n=1 Tax=Cryptomeria japonica TaxID=3369 RepID=UPI0027DA9747|nr:uncharacterized protein LOC131076211 isoform X2 [Cryptomeria japonica]